MTMLFQGAELEDFPTRVGTLAMVASPAGAFASANARGIIRINGGAEYVNHVQASFGAVTGLWAHTAFAIPHADFKGHSFLTLLESGTPLLSIRFLSSNSPALSILNRPGGSSTIATTGGVITNTNTRYVLDWYVKIGNPGSLRLYVGGTLAAYADDIDLSLGGAAGINQFRLSNHCNYATPESLFSEVIVADVPTIGAKLVTRIPDANGAHVEWTGGFGDIDELSPDGTPMTSDTAEQRASFSLTDFPAALSNETIASLKLNGWARCGVTGPQNANLFARVGGADYHAADQALASNYAPISSAWATNPAGGDWTAAALNAAEFGIRSRT